jgi:hypothetical protein
VKRSTKILAALPVLAALAAADAYAWGGSGRRDDNRPLPTDIDTSRKTENRDTLFVTGSISNVRNSIDLLCDIKGSIKVENVNKDFAIINAYANKAVIKAFRSRDQTFLFDKSEHGEGYQPIKTSQKVEPTCLTLDLGEDPSQVPPPHTKCDPDVEDCDWGCDGAAQDPSQCRSNSNDWPRSDW